MILSTLTVKNAIPIKKITTPQYPRAKFDYLARFFLKNTFFLKKDIMFARKLFVEAAYKSHITSPHFKHYKNTTLKMLKALRLVDMKAIDKETMPKIFEKLSK
jgi:CTP:phosphocholine cytidylyltransferase-like protein